MEPSRLWWLIPSFLIVAMLYSSVGHGGASGYLAILTLLPAGLAHEQMATTALTLNLLVAGAGLLAFARAGHFVAHLAWPFTIASIPAAFLGGLTRVPVPVYAILLALSLSVAALRLWMGVRQPDAATMKPPALAVALPVGGAIGWLSGVVGVGGGIFLSPLLLVLRWATPKQTAASSACFILANSAAGLLGRFARGDMGCGTLWPLVSAAFAGGLIGSRLGANHFSGVLLKRLLAVVLVVSSVKLLKLAWSVG